MNMNVKPWTLLVGLAALLGTASLSAQVSNGIYADFTTSMGSFTCRLDYAIAPKAVANFISLATGERAWLDLPTGIAKTNKFYDGLTFHRVISDFMIQAGSRNGLGTDDAGYSFVDEVSPSARFDKFGVLAMANSGPDSNGTQFFVTVAPATQLNDGYTIFGRLTGGSNVVYRISRVARDANNKPLTNVVIQSVNIRRVGTAAQAFNLHTNGLAVVTNLPLSIASGAQSASLSFSNRLHADNRLYRSTNFTDWTPRLLGIETLDPITNTVNEAAVQPAEFFKLAQIQYPSTRPAPKTLFGRTLIHSITNLSGSPTVTNFFDASGAGTYSYGTNQGTITEYTYEQDAYRGRLKPIEYSGLSMMVIHFNFASTTNGTFSGSIYSNPFFPVPISGWFRLQ